MSDKATEERALRTITISGKSALTHSDDPSQKQQVRNRIDGLLVDLEGVVIRVGADQGILDEIESSRRQLWEEKGDGDSAHSG